MTDDQTLRDAASRYIAAYNEPDPERTRELLGGSLSSKGRYISANQELGFEGVVEMATDFHDVASMRIENEIRVHGTFATFKWSFTDIASGETTTGIDFCEFGDDGLIDKVVVFFD